MTLDTKALDNAADTFSRSMRALNSMELADLPPELDQDARDLARIIQEHGKDYADTAYGDMTAPLLESLARLVQAAKAADRLAELEEQLHLANIDALQTEAERAALEAENQRLREANAEMQKQMARAWNDGFDFAMKACGWQEGEDPVTEGLYVARDSKGNIEVGMWYAKTTSGQPAEWSKEFRDVDRDNIVAWMMVPPNAPHKPRSGGESAGCAG